MKGKIALALISVFLLYEVNPAHYHAASCNDPLAESAGKWDYTYDGFYIGNNGCLYDPDIFAYTDIPPISSSNSSDEVVIYVNGANHRVDWVVPEMTAIAHKTHKQVISIYNSTAGGRFPDAITDSLFGSRSVDTVSKTINEVYKNNQTVHFKANSQGAIHLMDGLKQNIAEFGERPEQLKLLKIETAGAAESHYIDGPKYVHYVNKFDPVPRKVGVLAEGAQPGKLAKIIMIGVKDMNPMESKLRWIDPLTRNFFLTFHGFNAYHTKWQPFEFIYNN